MSSIFVDWHFVCQSCGYETSSLKPAVNVHDSHESVDEIARELALISLRQDNFKSILKLIQSLRPQHIHESLLDVGAAHGWFVELAKTVFTDVTGIEPDSEMCARAAQRGIDLRSGYFPQVLAETERFDVIIFNDVFEHIPDATATLQKIRLHLNPGGLLILNLPTNTGLFYRLAKLFKRFGISAPFDRMWQKGMPSPHLHYFSKSNLKKLSVLKGFIPLAEITLPSLKLKGLHARIALSRQHGVITTWVLCAGIFLLYPFTALFPKDVQVFALGVPIKDAAE